MEQSFLRLTDPHKTILEEISTKLTPYADQIFLQWRAAFRTTDPTITPAALLKMEEIYRSYFKVLEQEIEGREFYDDVVKTVKRLSLNGVTFGQLMLSFHFFEDSCLPYLKKIFPDKDRLIEALTAMDYSCHSCISTLAISYFDPPDSKTGLPTRSKASEALLIENYNLTHREFETLKLVVDGYTNREIAETLKISSKTVENHRANFMKKLGLANIVDLVKFAIRRQIV